MSFSKAEKTRREAIWGAEVGGTWKVQFRSLKCEMPAARPGEVSGARMGVPPFGGTTNGGVWNLGDGTGREIKFGDHQHRGYMGSKEPQAA